MMSALLAIFLWPLPGINLIDPRIGLPPVPVARTPNPREDAAKPIPRSEGATKDSKVGWQTHQLFLVGIVPNAPAPSHRRSTGTQGSLTARARSRWFGGRSVRPDSAPISVVGTVRRRRSISGGGESGRREDRLAPPGLDRL